MDRGFHTASAGHNLQFVPPMLLRRVPQLPEGPDWQYEVKWDGYRMQAIKCDHSVRLISRNVADYARRFPEVAEAVGRLKARRIHLDGELVAMDQQGRPSFQILQGGLPLPKGWGFGYYAFDLLHLGNSSLHRQPLSTRRAELEEVVSGATIRFSPVLKGTADQVVNAVREHCLEGIVAKRVDSLYEAGKRSGSWVKLPCKQMGQFMIGGYRPAHNGFGVVLVGHYDGPKFRFTGKVRHRLNEAARIALSKAFNQLRTKACPFSNLPNCKADPFDEMVTAEEMSAFIWVEPKLSVPVAFQEWTRMHALRQAEFTIVPKH